MSDVPLRALDHYKTWPGLSNPLMDQPTRHVRALLRERRERSPWYHVRSYAYRTRRMIGRLLRAVREEIETANKKTLIDIPVGGVAIALAIPPARERMTRWAFFWWVYAALLAVALANRIARRRASMKLVAARIRESAELIQLVIEFQRKHTKEHSRGSAASPQLVQNSVSNVLQAIADICRVTLQVPEEVHLHANVMVAMPVRVANDPELRHGCGIVAYNTNRPAEPAWTRVVWDDLGAGEAFATSKVRAIEDARDPVWCGVFGGTRSRSFASFPVYTDANKVVAVVNVDATRPMVITTENANKILYPAIAGCLKLLADILYCTRTGAITPRQPTSS